MEIYTLKSHLWFPKHCNHSVSILNPAYINLPIKTTSKLKHPTQTNTRINSEQIRQKHLLVHKPSLLTQQRTARKEKHLGSDWRHAFMGGAILLLFLLGEHRALAFGPDGPLMEDFWDNMRRYGLYILTVSSGVAYAILQPILELLKNPISAILILVIFGGTFYIVSQVLSAMVGVSEFTYQYGY